LNFGGDHSRRSAVGRYRGSLFCLAPRGCTMCTGRQNRRPRARRSAPVLAFPVLSPVRRSFSCLFPPVLFFFFSLSLSSFPPRSLGLSERKKYFKYHLFVSLFLFRASTFPFGCSSDNTYKKFLLLILQCCCWRSHIFHSVSFSLVFLTVELFFFSFSVCALLILHFCRLVKAATLYSCLLFRALP
jgi:hypothetical protein